MTNTREILKLALFMLACAFDVIMADKGHSEGYTTETTSRKNESKHGLTSYLTTPHYQTGTTESVSSVSQENSFNETIEFITLPFEIYIHSKEKDWSYIEQYQDLPPGDETKLFIETFQGELHRYVIAKQLSSCPYTPLCTYSLNATISDSNYKPCCAGCSCLTNCSYYNDCCPDIISDMHIDNKVRIVPSCIPLHLNIKFKLHSYNTLAISQCQTDTSYIYGVKCTQDYKTPSLRMGDILPVLHRQHGTVYRNIHCALCNSVDQGELEFFKPNLGCTQINSVSFKSESDLIQNIRTGFDCDIEFRHDHFTPDGCSLSISTCNETGLWDIYNAHYVSACASYSSVFTSNGMLFRNVFCAICNGFPADTPRCYNFQYNGEAIPYSFSGLLSFAVDTEDDHQIKANCIKGYIYHKEEDMCIPVRCSPTRMLINTVCVKIMDKVTSIKYTVSVRLTPSKTYSLEYAYRIADIVYMGLKQYMESHLAHNASLFHMCDSAMLLMIDRQCAQRMETDFYASQFLSYFLRIEFMIKNEHDPEAILSKLNKAYFGIRHETNASNEFIIVTVVNRYQEDFEIGNTLLSSGETEDTNKQVFCSFDNKTLIPKSPLPIDFNDFYQCFRMVGDTTPLASFLNCPMVELNTSFYPWVLNSDGVIFPVKYKSFTHEEFYLLEENNTTVLYLCTEQFFALTKTIDIAKWTFTAELVVSSACAALSIVCLFITLLIFCLLKPLQTLPGKNNISLVGTLLIAQSSYLIGSFSNLDKGSVTCKIIGILTHYSWLLVMFWMNICTFHMFRVLTKIKAMGHITGNKRFVLYHIYCVTFSAIFVLINVITSLVYSDFSDIGYGLRTCYISSKEMTIYTLGIPLAIIIVANIVMFLFVVVTIRRSSGVQKNVTNERNDIAIFARLSTLTGATWIFGFIYMWSQLRVFSYLFIILNAGQGLFIFLSFVCTSRVLKMLKQRLSSTPHMQTSSMRRTTSTHVSDK